MQVPLLSLIVPVYNEEETILFFLSSVQPILQQITPDYEIIFAADPCTDKTISILTEVHQQDPRIKIMVFSRRFGQHAATMAGLTYSRGQAVIPIDCDLQDPPELIPKMVELWKAGNKVVLLQRKSREGEFWAKRLVAYAASWFLNKISHVPFPRNTGEFRLMDRCVVEELIKFSESNNFLRGLVALVGFKTVVLPFDRKKRISGKSKYPPVFSGLRNGFNAIIGFSDYPLNLMVKVGFFIAAVSMLAAVSVLFLKLGLHVNFASGIPSVMILILFLGGINLVGMGVLGAYISRIYEDVKKRPKFIIDEKYGIE